MTKVALKSSHIYLESELVETIFGNVHYAYAAYLKDQQRLLITPITSQWFVKMYQPAQFLLKSRNLKGDKTLALREILLDNEIDTTDRELDVEIIAKTNLLKVNI